MAPKGGNAKDKGKGKGKAKDTSDAAGDNDGKKGGKGQKAANSINVRHILVCLSLFSVSCCSFFC